MKYFIISDIHGCYDQLVELLGIIPIDFASDRLIFTGDYIDRGPKVKEVLQQIKYLKQNYPNTIVLIRGNHEDMYITEDRCWDYNGNAATINSLTEDELSYWKVWLEKNTVLFYKDKFIQCCHAGVILDNIEEENPEILLWDRKALQNALYKGPLTVIGHTPLIAPCYVCEENNAHNPTVIRYQEYGKEYEKPKNGLIAIDTGCVFGYHLTALEINGNKIKFYKSSNK